MTQLFVYIYWVCLHLLRYILILTCLFTITEFVKTVNKIWVRLKIRKLLYQYRLIWELITDICYWYRYWPIYLKTCRSYIIHRIKLFSFILVIYSWCQNSTGINICKTDSYIFISTGDGSRVHFRITHLKIICQLINMIS